MISNYEFKIINGKQILYIYLNDFYEFADITSQRKRKELKETILDFIKENKIKFASCTVAIVVSGIVVSNMYLNASDTNNSYIPEDTIIYSEKNSEKEQLDNFDKSTDEKIDDEENTKITNTDDNEAVLTNAKNAIPNMETTLEKEESKVEYKQEEKTEEKIQIEEEESEKEIKVENDIVNTIKEPVTIFRSNGQIITLELEEYLINVVAAEMPASFNEEALKAQAVLARTYAKKAISLGRTLTDSTSTQVYKDYSQLRSMWRSDFDKYYSKIKRAVQLTEGEVLLYSGQYIEAVYHSTSNGYTEDSKNVWGNSFPYLKVVESSVDKSVKTYSYTRFLSYQDLSNMLGYDIDKNTEFKILSRNSSNRIESIAVSEHVYTGVKLRGLLSLRSADFEFEKTESGVNITTYGYGHGVGMSQYGANELAKKGFNYINILNHYYPGTSLVKS